MPPEGPLFEDFNLLRAATLAGQGISLCPLSIIHDDLVAGRLIQLSDIRVLEQSAYYLLQSDQALRAQRPEVALFVEWLMALGSRLA
jgi:DNA-binding transcriptional LysR family regulator